MTHTTRQLGESEFYVEAHDEGVTLTATVAGRNMKIAKDVAAEDLFDTAMDLLVAAAHYMDRDELRKRTSRIRSRLFV